MCVCVRVCVRAPGCVYVHACVHACVCACAMPAPKCPIGMQYSACGKSCSTTCQSLNIQEVCKEKCVDGCTCPGTIPSVLHVCLHYSLVYSRVKSSEYTHRHSVPECLVIYFGINVDAKCSDSRSTIVSSLFRESWSGLTG